MVLSNSSSRARNKVQLTNRCQGGGSKKAGLIPRENQPSAVSIAHLGGKPLGSQGHHKSLPQSMIMMPHQKNLTISKGIGRSPPIRHSAWNENGTSSKICQPAATVPVLNYTLVFNANNAVGKIENNVLTLTELEGNTISLTAAQNATGVWTVENGSYLFTLVPAHKIANENYTVISIKYTPSPESIVVVFAQGDPPGAPQSLSSTSITSATFTM